MQKTMSYKVLSPNKEGCYTSSAFYRIPLVNRNDTLMNLFQLSSLICSLGLLSAFRQNLVSNVLHENR